MSSPASPAADLLAARLDALLVAFFAVFADIRSVRAQLASSMSDGFFNIALARHCSPLLPLDQSSYAGRDMTAAATVAHTAATAQAGPIDFCLSRPTTAAAAAAASSDSSSASSAPSPIRPGVFSAHLSARERKLDALIAQRGWLDDAAERRIDRSVAAADMAASAPPAVPSLPSQPLLWFGLLAPPPLAAAQLAFQSALQRLTALAALLDRLRLIEREWMSALRQKDSQLADDRTRAAQRWKDASERTAEADDEDAKHSSAAWQAHEESKEHVEQKARGQSSSASSKLATQQRSTLDQPDTDEDAMEAMQSLTITQHRKKDS